MQLFTNAFGKCRVAAHEYRHVGAQAEAQGSQLVFAARQLPQVVEAEQGGGRIRAAAANAAAHGQAFVQPDIGTQGTTCVLLQQARGTHDQVAVMRHAVDGCMQVYLTVAAQGKSQLIAEVEKLKQGLQLVVTVCAAAKNMQHQVELGRCRQNQFGGGGYCRCVHWPSWRGCQSLITKVTCRSKPLSLIRSGSQKPFCSA